MSTLETTLLTTGQVARFLAVSDTYVRAIVRRGQLPAIRLNDEKGTRLFRLEDVSAFAAARLLKKAQKQ